MSRNRSRTSRFLLVALAATVALAVGTHFYKYRQAPNAQGAPSEQVVNVQSRTAGAPVAAVVVRAAAPTTAPAVAAASDAAPVAMLAAATTRPSALVMASAPSYPTAHSAIIVSAPASTPMTDAKAKLDSGNLASGRKILNDALLANTLAAADQSAARKLIADANKSLLFSTRKFSDDPFATLYTVKPGEKLSRIAANHSMTWELLARLNNISDPKKLRAGQSLKIIEGPFNAVVTKGSYTLDLYLGDPGKPGSLYVASYPVGLGQDDSTPTGVWMVEPQRKLKHPTYYSPRGEGVIESADPKNPLGPCWIGLTGTDGHAVGQLSYGIHGTNDPTSVGHQSSLGCIRMLNDDVAVVYDLLVEGKSIVTVRD